MRNLITAAASLLALAAASPAAAQAYVTAGAGLSAPVDPCLDMKTNRICVNLDNGHTETIGFGYDFGPVRIEAEGVFARSTVAEVFDARQSFNSDGSQARQSAMVNALVDIPLSRAVTAYAGGGAGISLMQMRATKPNSECREPLAVRIVHDKPNPREAATGDGTCRDQGDSKETGLTWQAIAGLDFAIGKGWSIGPQARYVAATGIHTAGKSLRTRETRFRSDETYRSLNALVAIRKAF